MNKRLHIQWGLLALVFIMGSCINDDLSDCPVNKYLYFETLNSKYTFREVVEKVDLYMYDGDKLVDTKTYSRTDIQATDYKIPLYDYPNKSERWCIALVNQTENCYRTVNADQIQTLQTELIATEGDTVKNRISDLFHGAKGLYFEYPHTMTDTIYLKKNTNDINLFVSFDGYKLPSGSRLDAVLSGTNGQYDSDNNPVKITRYTYLPYNQNVNDGPYAFTAHFTTMRLWIGGDKEIRLDKESVSDTGGPNARKMLHKLNVTEVLAQITGPNGDYLYDTNEKLEAEDVFNIFITLDGNFVILELKINDWFLIKDGIKI